jgi:hypothetical protein
MRCLAYAELKPTKLCSRCINCTTEYKGAPASLCGVDNISKNREDSMSSRGKYIQREEQSDRRKLLNDQPVYDIGELW